VWEGKVGLGGRAEFVDSVDLIVEHDLLFDWERIDQVADRLTRVLVAVVDGAKTLRLPRRRHATTLHPGP
jgi:hypothetical protein